MTPEEWDTVSLLLHRGFKWRDQTMFTLDASGSSAFDRTYRTLLDGYNATQLAQAIRRLVANGQIFGPTPGEITAALERDPSQPTFTEALHHIHNALRTQPAYTDSEHPCPHCDNGQRAHGPCAHCDGTGRAYGWTGDQLARLRDQMALDHAWQAHPLLGAFVQAYGLDRLRALGIDGEHAGVVRRDLEAEWEAFVAANAHRDATVLAAGRRRELTRGPRQISPANVLQADQPEEEKHG